MGESDPLIGERVRIDIPDESDPDHNRYHGQHGTVVGSMKDDADHETGDPRDQHIYRVQLEGNEVADFRRRDIRPAIED